VATLLRSLATNHHDAQKNKRCNITSRTKKADRRTAKERPIILEVLPEKNFAVVA
jgi:hypothetical protein